MEEAAAAGRLRATVRNKTVPQPFRRAVWAGLRRRTAPAFLFPRVRSGAGGCPVTARREEGDWRGGKMAKGAAPRARSGFPALTRRSPAPCCRAAEGHGGSCFPLGARRAACWRCRCEGPRPGLPAEGGGCRCQPGNAFFLSDG